MKSSLAPYTKVIAEFLLKATREEQRRTFAIVLAYIVRETGGEFESVHDFLTSRSSDIPPARREEILANVCRALRAGDLSALEVTS